MTHTTVYLPRGVSHRNDTELGERNQKGDGEGRGRDDIQRRNYRAFINFVNVPIPVRSEREVLEDVLERPWAVVQTHLYS